MGDSKSGVLSKMTIHSFEKNDFMKEDKLLTFSTPINPETFTKTSHIELDSSRGHGQPGTDSKYKSTAPEELKIEFVLDGTKTMEGYVEKYKNMEVTKQIKAFTDCVYKYEGKIHRPRFLIVRWGSEVRFPCVLSHMDVSYTLFLPNGNPLRAKISANFIKYETPIAMAAAARINSPDLTHYRVSKEGDRLDYLTYTIYDNTGYILQMARVNDLTSIRHIKPGLELYFPPIGKTDA
jgi:Contractile injection system tube protein